MLLPTGEKTLNASPGDRTFPGSTPLHQLNLPCFRRLGFYADLVTKEVWSSSRSNPGVMVPVLA